MTKKHKYLLALFIVVINMIVPGHLMGYLSTMVSIICFAGIAEQALRMGLFDLKYYIHETTTIKKNKYEI